MRTLKLTPNPHGAAKGKPLYLVAGHIESFTKSDKDGCGAVVLTASRAYHVVESPDEVNQMLKREDF